MPVGEVFVSHTHGDEGIADALDQAIKRLFGDQVTTWYSSKKELSGGIAPGEDWFRWIVERVRSADVAVILLTAASVQKPWVLWEAGAVYGAALAPGDTKSRKVRPLIFKLAGSQVPAPFANVQVVEGDQRPGIDRLLRDLIETFGERLQRSQVLRAGEVLGATVDAYLDGIERTLRDSPLLPTEAIVQEWCDRLDQIMKENRASEIEHLHDWLNVTFGRSRNEQAVPIDVRLHRRLGNAYMAAGRADRAASQFALALRSAPRDIFLLRSLGLAHLDVGDVEQAERVVDRIAELDKHAFGHNVECAALKGRLQRRRNDPEGATATYRQALDRNPSSYYLADILGQTLLQMGKLADAQEAYSRAVRIINAIEERNVWTYATQATASLVKGDEPQALGYLRTIAMLGPTPSDLARIEEGLRRTHEALNADSEGLQLWILALRTGR